MGHEILARGAEILAEKKDLEKKLAQLDARYRDMKSQLFHAQRKERAHRLIQSAAKMEAVFGYEVNDLIAERAARIAAVVDDVLGSDTTSEELARVLVLK